ncbi:MAG: Nucleoside diphosphate kinase [Parcubacteria group bacterium GW2011_GWA2_47_16]|nr:MAG: Nucleoside diphosphate kinase [Parcubacteria group bacterium GW2011_GWA2_47_16]
MKHLKNERTLIVIKPDGLQRTLVGEIIKRYERVGLKLVAIKMLVPNDKHVEMHYTLDPNWLKNVGEKSIEAYAKKGLVAPSNDPIKLGKVVLESLRKFMTSGPVVAMVWEGAHAVAIARKITGGTEPLTSGVGTIRGDFVLDSYQMADTDKRAVRNLIHASGSVAEAEMEVKHWFKLDEILNYRLIQEQILYDVNLDGLLE